MSKKIVLEFTEKQLESFLSIIGSTEAMIGGSDGQLEEGETDFDKETKKELKNIYRMFKSNGFKLSDEK